MMLSRVWFLLLRIMYKNLYIYINIYDSNIDDYLWIRMRALMKIFLFDHL